MARAALSLSSHTMLVVSPDHAQTFGHEGWSRETLAQHLVERIRGTRNGSQPVPRAVEMG